MKKIIICGLNFQECLQHTGYQCRGESKNCYWKNNTYYSYFDKQK